MDMKDVDMGNKIQAYLREEGSRRRLKLKVIKR